MAIKKKPAEPGDALRPPLTPEQERPFNAATGEYGDPPKKAA